jgi:AraC-like DNA-binding protein
LDLPEYLKQLAEGDHVRPERIAPLPGALEFHSKKWKSPTVPGRKAGADNHRTRTSEQLKRRILAAEADGDLSQEEIAQRFAVSISTVRRLLGKDRAS